MATWPRHRIVHNVILLTVLVVKSCCGCCLSQSEQAHWYLYNFVSNKMFHHFVHSSKVVEFLLSWNYEQELIAWWWSGCRKGDWTVALTEVLNDIGLYNCRWVSGRAYCVGCQSTSVLNISCVCWCIPLLPHGRVCCIVHADVTLTRSKVKVKVTRRWPSAPSGTILIDSNLCFYCMLNYVICQWTVFCN